MLRPLRALAVAALAAFVPHVSLAVAADDILRAEKILRTVVDLTTKSKIDAADLQAPEPLADKSGKFFAPFKADGTLTEWANKALSAQVGAALGAKAGEKATGMLASKVPLGGLLSGAAKKKGKELGAIAALGGEDFIKETSDLSFNSLDDLAVYMHAKHAGSSGYAQALATTIAIYPSLEKGYDTAIKKAVEFAKQKKSS